jgi:hypothetical protein
MSIGESDSNKTTTSNSTTTTNPYAPTVPALNSLISNIGGYNYSVNPTETAAFSQLQEKANQGNPFAAQTTALANALYATPSQVGANNAAQSQLQAELAPIANQNNNPLQNPGMAGLLATIANDTTNAINQEFAAAGRDGSGLNQQDLARGLSQGLSGAILGQYNTNVGAQTGAAEALQAAGTGTAQSNAALTAAQQAAALQGVQTGDTALAQQNYTPTQTLAIQQAQTALPFQNAGLLASILYPAAGLGGTSNTSGTSNTQGTTDSFGINLLSDERAKTGKQQVGELYDGTPVHTFQYKGDPTPRIGVMAQEVEKKAPDAVQEMPGGLKTVNIDAATRKAAEIARKRMREKLQAARRRA